MQCLELLVSCLMHTAFLPQYFCEFEQMLNCCFPRFSTEKSFLFDFLSKREVETMSQIKIRSPKHVSE